VIDRWQFGIMFVHTNLFLLNDVPSCSSCQCSTFQVLTLKFVFGYRLPELANKEAMLSVNVDHIKIAITLFHIRTIF